MARRDHPETKLLVLGWRKCSVIREMSANQSSSPWCFHAGKKGSLRSTLCNLCGFTAGELQFSTACKNSLCDVHIEIFGEVASTLMCREPDYKTMHSEMTRNYTCEKNIYGTFYTIPWHSIQRNQNIKRSIQALKGTTTFTRLVYLRVFPKTKPQDIPSYEEARYILRFSLWE
ncbi:hypothetical protein COOONC_05611 [Cooperia oncophora]